jgi:predicted kinase
LRFVAGTVHLSAPKGDSGVRFIFSLTRMKSAWVRARLAAKLPAVDARPTMYVTVGLPGSGKTTRARELEVANRAIRLTPDEWMIPLFGDHNAGGKRDVLEGRFVWLALSALRVGMSVVLDFGVWARDERSALRWLADHAGGECELVYVAVAEAERRRRVESRLAADPTSTFIETLHDFDAHALAFQAPSDDELAASPIDAAPDDYDDWGAWAAERWPTSHAL